MGSLVAMPGIFEHTIFSKRMTVVRSMFIKAMHPKTEIRPDRAAIKRILDAGWWGQMKIHGHRAQIHIPADETLGLIAYTRHGTIHKTKLPNHLGSELRRLFVPTKDWTVIDAEWLKGQDHIYVFDLLKLNGQMLNNYTYGERWELLPRVYKSAYVETLGVVRTLDKCMEILESTPAEVEGLVFKSASSPGFNDRSIVRCRKV